MSEESGQRGLVGLPEPGDGRVIGALVGREASFRINLSRVRSGHGTFQPAILTLQLLEPFILIDLQAPYSFRQR